MQAPGSRPARGRRRRLADGLIGLSSVAIATVYAVGYLKTDSGSHLDNLAGVQPATPTAQPQVFGPQRQTQPAATPRASSGAQGQTISYQDGTYTGMGTSRHGNIEATVVVQGGKIVSASVSRCLTRYSCSYVSQLVSETVSRQAVPVSHISGATDSSQAYKQAVQNALAKAAALS
jgi:uncharacterized protein with FMN-binding domain